MKKCTICPWECKVNRIKKLGVCRAPNQLEIAHWQIHQWEEPCISGQNPSCGSGTIFFSHCNLRCAFCQNYEISQINHGQIVSEKELLKICLDLKKQGAYNINLVSPTPYSIYLKNFLEKNKKQIDLPIIWNSNSYEKTETIKSLSGLVDVWLPDLKYYNDKIAQKYSGAKNYFQFASQAILEMRQLTPKDIFNPNGLIEKGLIIRHLVLPGQIKDSLKILSWIKNYLGQNTILSLMSQYYPVYQAYKFPEINRRLKSQEYQVLIDWLIKNDFKNVFVQDLSSANKNFTPKFKNKTR
ncbi:MAG: radical SAM protein [Patescibacteria group bacterium]